MSTEARDNQRDIRDNSRDDHQAIGFALMQEKLDRLMAAIDGNGKPGLKQLFADHLQSEIIWKANHEQETMKWRYWLIGTIMLTASGGVTSGALFFNILKEVLLKQ